MKLFDSKIGAEGSIAIELTSGALVLKAIEDTPGIKITLAAEVPLAYSIDAAADKSGSPLLKAVAGILDGVLKTIS